MSEQSQESQGQAAGNRAAPLPAARRLRRWYQKVGCVVALLVWLIVMLIPCFFITLAFRQEIVIAQGSAPNQVFRVWLINEADYRGLGISTTSIHPGGQEGNLCVQTDVHFLLWVGEGEPMTYCECYLSAGDNPVHTSTTEGQCAP